MLGSNRFNNLIDKITNLPEIDTSHRVYSLPLPN